MSANNPSTTASDIITDVEARLDSPGISTSNYLPWISYAYQRTYAALISSGQSVKENLFGDVKTFDLSNGTAEYSITTNIPRFGGFIKVEIKYGADGDDWIRATRLPSVANYSQVQSNSTTAYRAKDAALYYQLGDLIGFIPTPPSTDPNTPVAKVFYIKRPYQIDSGDDVIDIPYRFIYPIVNYVQAKAIERENEDYGTAGIIESKFQAELQEMIMFAMSEINEHEVNAVQADPNSELFISTF